MVETDVAEGLVKRVIREEVVETMQKMKSGKATGLSKVCEEMNIASGAIGI